MMSASAAAHLGQEICTQSVGVVVDRGNTVVVIEHNLDVIKTADHVIDLGPEGGDGGGYIIATGTPEEIAKTPDTPTGEYLKKMLAKQSAQSAKTGIVSSQRN
jgi:excinuclease ABC subunit A